MGKCLIYITFICLGFVMITSCGSGNDILSQFSSRKYLKKFKSKNVILRDNISKRGDEIQYITKYEEYASTKEVDYKINLDTNKAEGDTNKVEEPIIENDTLKAKKKRLFGKKNKSIGKKEKKKKSKKNLVGEESNKPKKVKELVSEKDTAKTQEKSFSKSKNIPSNEKDIRTGPEKPVTIWSILMSIATGIVQIYVAGFIFGIVALGTIISNPNRFNEPKWTRVLEIFTIVWTVLMLVLIIVL